MVKYHHPKLIGHEQLGQANKYLLFDISKSCGAQILKEIWLLTYSSSLTCRTWTAEICLFWVNMAKHPYPKLIVHEQLGQAHSDLSSDISNSSGAKSWTKYDYWPSPPNSMQDGAAKISLLMVNITKHHCPKLIGHLQLGQAHSDLSIEISNSFGGQKVNKLWLLTYSSY